MRDLRFAVAGRYIVEAGVRSYEVGGNSSPRATFNDRQGYRRKTSRLAQTNHSTGRPDRQLDLTPKIASDAT
jgi:hypothetical protein